MSENEKLERRVVTLASGGTRYCVVGPMGAVDFHVEHEAEGACGLERHSHQPPSYRKDEPAHTDNCWLLNGPCWTDGTSLYAREWLMPGFRDGLEAFWPVLEHEYRRAFAPDQRIGE